MSNIEKIRQEIERISSRVMNEDGQDICKYLLSFIDSLPEEKPSKDLEKAAEEYSNKNEYMDAGFCVEPVYIGHKTERAFIAGAKWQKEQDTVEMVMSDGSNFQKCYALGKKDMKEQLMKEGLDAVKSCQFDKIDKTIAGVFVKYGMDMQKQDMMKEAVEGEVVQDLKGRFHIKTNAVSDILYHFGDRVKVLILPEKCQNS